MKCNKANITCYNCGEKGHYRNECPKLKKEEKKESKDEEKKDGEKLSAATAEEEIAWRLRGYSFTVLFFWSLLRSRGMLEILACRDPVWVATVVCDGQLFLYLPLYLLFT